MKPFLLIWFTDCIFKKDVPTVMSRIVLKPLVGHVCCHSVVCFGIGYGHIWLRAWAAKLSTIANFPCVHGYLIKSVLFI